MHAHHGRAPRADKPSQAPAGGPFAPPVAGGDDPVRSSHELAESAPLCTTPMPFDVAADHEPVIVYVSEMGPIEAFHEIQAGAMEALTREASRRGCDAVYGVQQSMAATGSTLLITVMGTGARPVVDLDQPPGPRA